MKVIILAGGFATKLYPLTENEPKSMLEVGGKSVIDHLVSNFESTKRIDEYIVVTNHRFYARFSQWALTRREKITVLDDGAADNSEVYGAVKDIKLAVDKCSIDENCFIITSDLLFDFSFMSFVDYCIRKNTDCCMRFYEENEIKLYRNTVADMGPDDKVKSIVCKPREPFSNWCIPHFYYLLKEDIARIDEAFAAGIDPNSIGQFIEYLSKTSVFHSVEMPGIHARITNEASLRSVRKNFNPFS